MVFQIFDILISSKDVVFGPVWELSYTFYLVILENITIEIPQDLNLFFSDTRDPIERFYVTSQIC